jgi:hypothetical protein
VSDHRDVLEIQRLDEACQIVRIPVHVVAGRSLAGSAMATTIVRTTRKPCCARNSIWPSHISEFNGHPCEKRYDWAVAPVLVDRSSCRLSP